MGRLNKDRQAKLEPQRVNSCLAELKKIDSVTILNIEETRIDFSYEGNTIMFFPYSGWHSGKGIKDGRGFKKLIRQLK